MDSEGKNVPGRGESKGKAPKQELACHVPRTAGRLLSPRCHGQGRDEVREAMGLRSWRAL